MEEKYSPKWGMKTGMGNILDGGGQGVVECHPVNPRRVDILNICLNL
jgi:hypothetical protein